MKCIYIIKQDGSRWRKRMLFSLVQIFILTKILLVNAQTLSRIINGLINEKFVLAYFSEIKSNYPGDLSGSWGHFTEVAPPWLNFLWYYHSNFSIGQK